MSKAASEKFMAKLHADVAAKLSREVTKQDLVDEAGKIVQSADPRYVQMAIKFLSDNKIFMVPDVENTLGELDRHLKKRQKRDFGKGTVTDISTRMAKQMEG